MPDDEPGLRAWTYGQACAAADVDVAALRGDDPGGRWRLPMSTDEVRAHHRLGAARWWGMARAGYAKVKSQAHP